MRRQRTRLALKHEKRVLQKAEIALGREGTAEAANFPEVRNEIVALKKLEQEQKEVAVRIAKIEEALKQIEAQRQENSSEQGSASRNSKNGKRPLVERRNERKPAAERCDKELATVDRRIQENEAADRELLKKLSVLEATEPPPADLQLQMDRISARNGRGFRARKSRDDSGAPRERGGLPRRQSQTDLREEELDRASGQEHRALGANSKSRDRTLNESSRAQQEEVKQARQQHQTRRGEKESGLPQHRPPSRLARHRATERTASARQRAASSRRRRSPPEA